MNLLEFFFRFCKTFDRRYENFEANSVAGGSANFVANQRRSPSAIVEKSIEKSFVFDRVSNEMGTIEARGPQ